MKVVFGILANFLSISPNQTPVFAVCLPGPRWTFLPFLFLLILYSLPYMYRYFVHTTYMFSHPQVLYVISCAVNIRLQLYTCFLTLRSKHASSKFWMISAETPCWEIHRKKIAKFLMRTFTCRSNFLSALLALSPVFQSNPLAFDFTYWIQAHNHLPQSFLSVSAGV